MYDKKIQNFNFIYCFILTNPLKIMETKISNGFRQNISLKIGTLENCSGKTAEDV
jgi:hypothetical protein